MYKKESYIETITRMKRIFDSNSIQFDLILRAIYLNESLILKKYTLQR